MILLLSAILTAAPVDDIVIRLEDPAAWIAQPSWLGNPGDRIETARGSEGVVFRVLDPGRGMKWRMPLEKPIPLAPVRFVTIRYRANGSAPHGDYALAILGGPEGGPEDYRTPIAASDLRADGVLRHATNSLGDTAGTWILRGLAFQVQAGADPAEVEVAEIRFTADRPLAPLAEVLPFERLDPGAPKDARFEEIDIEKLATFDASTLRRSFGLAEWFPDGGIAISGIPLRIRPAPRSAAATGLEPEGAIRVPLAGRASEIAILLAAHFVGDEEPSLGSGELREIRDVDRAIFRIEYADGPADEMLCLSLPEDRFAIARGPQLAIVFADPAREMEAFEIVDRSAQIDLALVAATALRDEEGLFGKRRPAHRVVPPIVRPSAEDVPARISLDGSRARIESGSLRATIDLSGFRIESLENVGLGSNAVALPSRLLRIAIGGRSVEPEAWTVIDAHAIDPARLDVIANLKAGDVDLVVRGEIACRGDEIAWSAEVENRGADADIEITSPEIAGLRTRDPATDLLFYPKRGAVLTAESCAFSRPGSGLFPVQFIDLSAPAGGGIYIRTEDREGRDRLYQAAKGREGARLAVVYPSRRLERGAARILAGSVLGVHAGDWHEAFGAYERWLATWHRPRMPLKPWFREIFNFRQRFFWFWDPLYDKETGRFRMAEAVAEVDECFGGMEYLHLMDWGSHPQYGRVYGRTGDHAPWDAWKGGAESLAKAMPEAGVPVGMYVEGYLLEERGKLGQGAGKAWQILGPGGERRYWPGATEMFICPWVSAWKDVQVDTYRRLARMFPMRGFYIDQFGFADWGKMCWSPDHGHAVPASPLKGEIALTRAVDDGLARIDPGIAIYTEETPCDLANGWQDGSFTYAMNDALRSTTDVPLNIARFAFPAFKTFEILVCDRPTGSWATGVLWTFWNGEGIWLEGPAREWFRPRTLETIRKTHAILRRYRNAFATLEPEPLVETRVAGLYANRFPGRAAVVYTIWNALPRTFRGDALAIPRSEGDRFFDAWNERDLVPRRRQDGTMSVPLEIPPHGVACVAVGSARRRAAAYGLEELRGYIERSRRAVEARRPEPTRATVR
ncbi:MAG: hypothetical protein JXP34_00595 [Planctomycetes bacterium]|nr:hypothetical protein [Planctomycetota bacterium]